MSSKKKFLITILFFIIPICIATVLMYIIDPFFHWHKPFDGVPYTIREDVYVDPGILRNYDYDSVLIGSSLAALMEPSILDEKLGTKTVKATINGGTVKNGIFLMDYALANNPKLKNIVYSLDYAAISGDPNADARALPEYLYDKNPLNDFEYVLNKDILYNNILPLFDESRKSEQCIDFDSAFGFDKYVRFAKNNVLEEMSDDLPENAVKREGVTLEYNEFQNRLMDVEADANVVANLQENLLSYIRSNPNINFTFYMAPRPIVYWYQNSAENDVIQMAGNLQYIFYELDSLDNVKLYFFYNDKSMYDLYRFCDSIHFDRNVGRMMFKEICKDDSQARVTYDNAQDIIYDFYTKIVGFDYGIYSGANYPFTRSAELGEWLDMTEDDELTKIVMINKSMNTEQIDSLQRKGLISGDAINNLICDTNEQEANCGKYVSIVQNGEIIFEWYADEPFEVNVDDCKMGENSELAENSMSGVITLVTRGVGDEPSIMIADGEYCPEDDDIEIIVYDENVGLVVDSIGVSNNSMEIIHY